MISGIESSIFGREALLQLTGFSKIQCNAKPECCSKHIMSLLAESGDYYWQSDTLPLIFVKERHKNGDNNDNNGDKQTIRNFIKK